MSKKHLLILFPLLVPIIILRADINGFWQEKTPSVSSGYLSGYQFQDSTFQYRTNEYDCLNPIRYFGGTYSMQSDTLILHIY